MRCGSRPCSTEGSVGRNGFRRAKGESRAMRIITVTLKVLFGLALCGGLVYLALYSNLLDSLEGPNLDGSVSITWRSGIALIFLIAVCQLVSFLAFRRGTALVVGLGLAACVVASYLLFGSKLGFIWEPHNADGTFPITWRSDLVVISLLSVTQGIAFLSLRMIGSDTVKRDTKRVAAHPNI